MPNRLPLLLLVLLSLQSAIRADEQVVSIAEHGVAELLSRRCLSCHNDADQRGEFSLQSQTSLEKSGMVIAGDPDSSYLLDVIQSHAGKPPQMPKAADPLSTAEVKKIRNWIAAGANWPAGFKLEEPVVSDFDWWSFQPLIKPELPVVAAGGQATNPIDLFIARTLEEKGLTPSPPADKRTLIRRLTYDLTGLPPTPEEIENFLADDSADAYQRIIERLLASPAYGEHWARHWLDVVKYADTCGYDKDKLRENAWPYRDYVIDSFNVDKPYGRFVQEQIAGDVLFPGEPDGVLGLGFIAAGPWDFIGHVEVPESKLDGKVARNLDRDDMVSNTLNTFCSVTIQCARCHNHKFDPFTQEHYYSLQSVFAAVDRAERPYDLDPAVEQRRRELERQHQDVLAAQRELQAEIDQAGGERLKKLSAEIAELKKAAQPPHKEPQYGYHSQIVNDPEKAKWVQIDLGEAVELTNIVLHPCHDDYADIGAGFGFPVRYRIEGALQASDFDERTNVVLLADEEENDVSNPGLMPVTCSIPGTRVRFVRVTATRLAERKKDFIFALAELEAIDKAGLNVARNATVTALDSIEAPVRWGKKNLTDGIWAQAADQQADTRLNAAISERDHILKAVMTPERISQQAQLSESLASVKKELAELPQGKMVYAAATHFQPQGNFKPTEGTPREIRMLHRGNIQQPKEAVSPGVLPLRAGEQWQFSLPEGHSEGERRAALAKWIADRNNPLTWRSIVNRIWLYHFGEGLVASPNDFGRMGQLPSHLELLDWLAVTFRDEGQSLKDLHRLIVSSETYQQGSDHHEANAAIDGSNRFLWRMNRKRLTAEEIRDSILVVSGQLDRTSGGPGDRLFVLEHPQHSPHYEYHLFDPANAARHRRSIYRFVVRSQPDPWMTVLDCADSSQSTPKRSETLTALQALSLMNNDFNLVMAERFAQRLQAERPTLSEQIQRGLLLATGRTASAEEVQLLSDYAVEHGFPNTCRLLLNLSEFVFVD